MRTAALFLLYASAACFGTYLVFMPTFESGFAYTQTERGDGILNHYILENSWKAVSDPDYCGTLLSPPMFFPAKYTIFYSETLFGVAPLYWLCRLVLPFDLAYAWWQILLNLLNFVAFAVVARWLRWPHLVAVGGAFMWAFAMVHADQIKHQQLIGRFWMPLAAYYAISLLAAPSTKALNRLFLCVFMQCLACVYTGWFLVMGLAVFMPAMAAMRPGTFGALWRFAREQRGRVVRIVGLWGVAMGALFVPYVLVNWGIARAYEDCYYLMPTPSAWITGPPDSKWIITTSPHREKVYLESWLFSGFTFYLLMLASVLGLFLLPRDEPPAPGAAATEPAPAAEGASPAQRPRVTVARAVISASMLTVLAWVLLTLTPQEKGESLWRIVRYVPGAMAIRCVARVYLVIYLFGTIAGMTWLSEVTRRIRREWLRYAVQAAVVGLLIFEQTEYQQPSYSREKFYPLVDRTAERLKGAEAGWVVPRYIDENGESAVGPYGEVFAMWVGLRANVPVVNGYSGRAPKGFPQCGVLRNNEEIHDWLKGKFRGRVRIVDCEAPPGHTFPDVVVE
jgi:hypothetical protein